MDFKIKKSKRVFNDFFQVEKAELDYDHFDGGRAEDVRRYTIFRPEAIAIILENTSNGKIVLVKQFRIAPTYKKFNGWPEEIIAGILDTGEAPESCVHREVLEETGYELNYLEKINSYMPSIGTSSEVIHLYYGKTDLSKKVTKGGGLEEENEDIEVVEKSLEEIMIEIDNGKIIDGKTIVAVQWLLLKKNDLLNG